jgi:hypothetical protein
MAVSDPSSTGGSGQALCRRPSFPSGTGCHLNVRSLIIRLLGGRIMAVNDVWQFNIQNYGRTQLGEMVVHAITTAEVGTGATVQQVADGVSAAWAPLIKPWMSPTFSYRGVTARKVFPIASKTNPINSVSGQGAGTAAAGDLPGQMSGLITLRSALVGRRGQGRVYVPFPATAMLQPTTGGVIAAGTTILTSIAALLNAGVTFGTGGNTTTIAYAVYSRKFGAAGTLVQVFPSANFATQRRRGAFGKVNAMPF